MNDDLIIKLPPNVDWRGPHELLKLLLLAVQRSCNEPPAHCGRMAPGFCTMCEVLRDQAALDRLKDAYFMIPKLAEWEEACIPSEVPPQRRLGRTDDTWSKFGLALKASKPVGASYWLLVWTEKFIKELWYGAEKDSSDS